MNTLPAGWRIARNSDGSIGIFAPPPMPGESARTSEAVYPSDNRDLHELLSKLVEHLIAHPDYHCTVKCANCGHKNYFTLRELANGPAHTAAPNYGETMAALSELEWACSGVDYMESEYAGQLAGARRILDAYRSASPV